MKEKVLRKKVTRENFYKEYMKALNGYLNLTNREFEVMVELCNIQAQHSNLNYTPEQLSKVVFGPVSREIIRTHLSISPYNLNNIIKSLKTKKLITESEDGYYFIHSFIWTPLPDKGYDINYKFELI